MLNMRREGMKLEKGDRMDPDCFGRILLHCWGHMYSCDPYCGRYRIRRADFCSGFFLNHSGCQRNHLPDRLQTQGRKCENDAGNPPVFDTKPAPVRRSARTEKWMTSQLPALYLQKKKTSYRDDYIQRLENIGFQENDAERRKTESRGICLCSLFSNRMNVLFYAEQSGAVRYDQIAFISFG